MHTCLYTVANWLQNHSNASRQMAGMYDVDPHLRSVLNSIAAQMRVLTRLHESDPRHWTSENAKWLQVFEP
eukprot:3813869-Alexandrium_andersonii.AAC.1